MKKRFSIRVKLLSAFLAMIVISLSIVGVSLLGYNQVYKKIIPTFGASKEIEILINDLETIERDFYIYGKYDEELYSGTNVYGKKFNDEYNDLIVKLDEVEKGISELNEEFDKSSFKEIKEQLNQYNKGFQDIVTHVKNIGIENYGYAGEMRGYIHNVEEVVKKNNNDRLIILLLELRRNEKDFMLRKSLKYREKFNSSAQAIKEEIMISDFEDKEKLNNQLELYEKIFNKIVDENVIIGLTSEEGLFGDNSKSIEEVHVHFNVLKDAIDQEIADTEFMVKGTLIIMAVISSIIAIICALVLSGIISKPIKSVNILLNDIAEGDGDLTKTLTVKSRDELNEMAHGFNKFVDKIKNLIIKVKEQSDNLNSSVTEINYAIESANNNVQDISVKMDVVSDSVQNNSSLAEEISASIEEISNGAYIVSNEATEIDDDSKSMMSSVNYGVEKLNEVHNSINSVKGSSKEIFDIMKEFNELSSRIHNITNMITDISDQTNLLALNAAIEAARAGEQGRGFAVVAEEIRKLAEESKDSANSITEIVSEINVKSEEAYKKIEEEQDIVDNCVDKATETNAEFKNIIDLIEGIVNKIKNISSLSKNQSNIIEEIARGISDFSQSTQETAVSSDEINNRIEGQAATFEEIGAQSEMLKSLSDNLNELIELFKVQ
ncbi:methyl-accepting chemotaxis protein [Oceanirhabdus seepicola]|uniref:Methyl-accepting chemotaxis protein n=1 Tax=Oceanirhabdus seepicola TaxID=2828781 RepID=A0A9J6PAR8_9CLOT|nr:methyl-accepting chemotaxis protein [Oceanirhabdus seepicola]MCM1992272.1 methyl-accepting chemotaxis protein [Oceanirhabdus seepicola]